MRPPGSITGLVTSLLVREPVISDGLSNSSLSFLMVIPFAPPSPAPLTFDRMQIIYCRIPTGKFSARARLDASEWEAWGVKRQEEEAQGLIKRLEK